MPGSATYFNLGAVLWWSALTPVTLTLVGWLLLVAMLKLMLPLPPLILE